MAAPIFQNMAALYFNKNYVVCASLLIAVAIICVDGARLSDPKILLPYHSSVITNFTLRINLTRDESRNPNCYTWSVMIHILILFFVLNVISDYSKCLNDDLKNTIGQITFQTWIPVLFTEEEEEELKKTMGKISRKDLRSSPYFNRKSSRLDVATVQLINSTDNECALSAEISAVSKSSARRTTIVVVENKVTGELLKCIVIVDSLRRIEIETTTRLLYLEDSPEELMVRGYDAEGNVFSSLRGLEFKWSIHTDTSGSQDVQVDANSILKMKQFIDSHYTTPSFIDILEERGSQGDIILVEGERTGSAIVMAMLTDPVYKTVDPSRVKLTVIANLMVSPPEAYVLKYATVKYKVEQIRQNSVVEIKMPSSQFYLEVVDPLISVLESASSVATALELGETEIKLIDKNVKSSDALGQPSAILHVVNPSYLAFVVLPDRKWVLETGRVYEVLIEVYDRESHKLFPSDNVLIDALFPSSHFEVTFSTKNGTYHVVKTLKRGETDIEGALTTVIRGDGSEFNISPLLKQTQFVEIFDPIIMIPNLLFFPWDVVSQTKHQYMLKATGGSGEYTWSSDNSDVVTVNKFGEITTAMKGQARVTAADKRNTLHKGKAEVHVLPPTDMQFKPYRVEVQVGNTLDLPLDVISTYLGKKFSFNDCRNMPLNITFSDPSVVEHVDGYTSLKEGSCRTVKVKATQQGSTKVKATYNHGGVKLESSITIAAYDALVPIDPEREAAVTIGAAKEVIFSGGPQPWVLDSSKYFQRPHNDGTDVEAEESKYVLIDPVTTYGTQKKYHSFFVTCKTFGEITLTLQVGNDPTAKNPNPAVEEASVSFICAEPVEIHLEPQIDYPKDLPPCPASREPNLPIPVHCKRDLNLGLTVTDKNGHRFDNISSLDFEWMLSDGRVASLPDGHELESDITITATGRKVVNNYITLRPSGIPDTLVVTVTASKYKTKYLQLAQSTISERISPKIKKSIELVLVEEAVISPGSMSVFNHPSNKVNVDVEKGSGYFYVIEGRMGVVNLKYLEKKKQLQVIPVKDGELSVTVYDLCIYSPQPATVTVSVSGVGSVQLYVMDKVEVGKDVTARVQVLDATGTNLYASFFPLMGLQLEPGSDLITVKPDVSSPHDEYTALYTVHGAVVGHTSLRAVAYLPNDERVTSHSRPVEVFPPLQLIPRNITLIIGALFQVLSKGGPRPQSTVVFSIKDSKIATVSSSGLLDAQALGSTRVVGQAVGQDPETGETVVYSQDEVTVNVVRLVGIRIHAPLTRLQTGTTMPLYAVGLTEHETPFTFGSADPPLSFKWTVNKKDVAKLQSVFYKSGIQPQPEGNFAVQMVAMETGHVSVRLKVTPKRGFQQVFNDINLTDELQVQVFKELAMLNPRICDGELLMTPNTEAALKSNRDGEAVMKYVVMSEDRDLAIIRVEDGVVIAGSQTGQVALHVIAVEEFGISQTLVLLVKVKPVSYLMINSDTTLRTSSGQLSSVPRGTTLQFTVTYHDDVGDSFYATNVDMRYRCSRYDLVQVSHGMENNTLVVKTAAVGHTILKVWDGSKPWLVDYISVPVGYAIEPAQPRVQLGDIICFSTPVIAENGIPGSWESLWSSSMSVDQQLGIGVATAVGTGTVAYTLSDEISTETEVSVSPVSEVFLEMSSDFISTVTDKNKVYNMYVSFGDNPVLHGSSCDSVVKETGFKPSRMPFTCDLDLESTNQDTSIAELFTVSAVFVPKAGRYACQIVPVVGPTSQVISTMETSVRLQATLLSSKGQMELRSTLAVVPFLPPFYIHNADIHVSTINPLSSVRVSTTANLADCIKAEVSDSTILEALKPERDSQSRSVIIYPIRLLDTITLWEREQLDVWVNLICQKTGQKVKIPVYVRLIGQKPDMPLRYAGGYGWTSLFRSIVHNYQYWFLLLIIIIITAITVLFAYHVLYGPRHKTAPATAYTLSPAGVPPMAPTYSPGMTPPPYSPYQPQYPPQTPKSPMLWSTGYTPLDGSSPTRRRSPIQRISPS